MPLRVEVELDIFSGMPNPIWTLSERDARTLLTRLAELPVIGARALPGHLGYRGFSLKVSSGTETREMRVQAGFIRVVSSGSEVFYDDRDRTLERWLLDSGLADLDDKVRSIVANEFPKRGENPGGG